MAAETILWGDADGTSKLLTTLYADSGDTAAHKINLFDKHTIRFDYVVTVDLPPSIQIELKDEHQDASPEAGLVGIVTITPSSIEIRNPDDTVNLLDLPPLGTRGVFYLTFQTGSIMVARCKRTGGTASELLLRGVVV